MVDQRPPATGAFAGASPARPRLTPAFARAVIGAVAAAVPPGSLVVDPAAGTGLLAGQLHRARLSVVALERSPESVEALVRSLPSVPVLQASLDAVPLRRGSVGALALSAAPQVLAAALSELVPLLAPGGVLALLANRPTASDLGDVEADGDGGVVHLDRALSVEGFGPAVHMVRPRGATEAVGVTESWIWRRG